MIRRTPEKCSGDNRDGTSRKTATTPTNAKNTVASPGSSRTSSTWLVTITLLRA